MSPAAQRILGFTKKTKTKSEQKKNKPENQQQGKQTRSNNTNTTKKTEDVACFCFCFLNLKYIKFNFLCSTWGLEATDFCWGAQLSWGFAAFAPSQCPWPSLLTH